MHSGRIKSHGYGITTVPAIVEETFGKFHNHSYVLRHKKSRPEPGKWGNINFFWGLRCLVCSYPLYVFAAGFSIASYLHIELIDHVADIFTYIIAVRQAVFVFDLFEAVDGLQVLPC